MSGAILNQRWLASLPPDLQAIIHEEAEKANSVVLAWGDARGLVMAECRRNPRMDVFIRGGSPTERQELAGVVRSNMEAIHRGLPDGLWGREELDLTVHGDSYESVEKLERLEEDLNLASS